MTQMVKRWIVIFTLCWISIGTTLADSDTVIVNSNSGKIKGIAVPEKNETVYQFRKIPFAKPPIGKLRFEKPEPYGTWNDILNGTAFGSSCMQVSETGKVPNITSEDCLFLNIYVPRNISDSNNMTVMVWIHGGSYVSGSGMDFDGSYLALTGNVIIVTINYRLNIFGFLSTGDSAAVGNYGLWDQRMAIEWVKSNIYAFGGNPHSITIFGQSAGSFSIGLQTLYPNNHDLFQRAIMESGFGNSFAGYIRSSLVLETAKAFGEILSCNVSVTNSFVECLRRKTSVELAGALPSVLRQLFDPKYPNIGLYLGPVIDGDFIKDFPDKLLSNTSSPSYKTFRSLDIMAGTVSAEGSLALGRLLPYQQIYNFSLTDGIPKSVLCNHISPSLALHFYHNNKVISTEICKKYGVTGNDVAEEGRQVVNIYGDLLFVSPAVKTLQVHSMNNSRTKSFQYLFTYFNPNAPGSHYPSWFIGASHAAELKFLFDIPFAYKNNVTVPDDEVRLSNYMLKYWTNFAKFGNPNGDSLPTWPEFETKNGSYLELDLNVTAKSNLYPDRMDFWLNTIPKLEQPTTTVASTSSSPSISTTSRMISTTLTEPHISMTTTKPSVTTHANSGATTTKNYLFIISVIFLLLHTSCR